MGPITESMIRRRAEHNDGVLETLEELVLQEEGIDKIEILSRLCPSLKQLYMPNNLIPRIENIYRLKSLEYLNLALNNIAKVEGLQGCEMLKKLDLTLNFLDKESLPTVLNLRSNPQLAELFLTGNPCTDFPDYRKYVIAAVPSLKKINMENRSQLRNVSWQRLDAHTIKPSERIAALQEFRKIQEEIVRSWIASGAEAKHPDLKESQKLIQEVDDKGEILREYSAATRLAEHKEMQDMKAQPEQESKAKSTEQKSKRRKGFDPLPTSGRIFQKNEGGWDFKLTETECGNLVVLDVAVGRYLDTSLIDIDLHPWWARILVKGKLLQLKLPAEVKTDESSVQRSTTTGHLVVTCPKVVSDTFRRQSLVNHGNNHPIVPHLKTKTSNSALNQKSRPISIVRSKDATDTMMEAHTVDIHHVVKSESISSSQRELGEATMKSSRMNSLAPSAGDGSDRLTWESDVPPLE